MTTIKELVINNFDNFTRFYNGRLMWLDGLSKLFICDTDTPATKTEAEAEAKKARDRDRDKAEVYSTIVAAMVGGICLSVYDLQPISVTGAMLQEAFHLAHPNRAITFIKTLHNFEAQFIVISRFLVLITTIIITMLLTKQIIEKIIKNREDAEAAEKKAETEENEAKMEEEKAETETEKEAAQKKKEDAQKKKEGEQKKQELYHIPLSRTIKILLFVSTLLSIFFIYFGNLSILNVYTLIPIALFSAAVGILWGCMPEAHQTTARSAMLKRAALGEKLAIKQIVAFVSIVIGIVLISYWVTYIKDFVLIQLIIASVLSLLSLSSAYYGRESVKLYLKLHTTKTASEKETDNGDNKAKVTDNGDNKAKETDNGDNKAKETDNGDNKAKVTDNGDNKAKETDNGDNKAKVTDNGDNKAKVTDDKYVKESYILVPSVILFCISVGYLIYVLPNLEKEAYKVTARIYGLNISVITNENNGIKPFLIVEYSNNEGKLKRARYDLTPLKVISEEQFKLLARAHFSGNKQPPLNKEDEIREFEKSRNILKDWIYSRIEDEELPQTGRMIFENWILKEHEFLLDKLHLSGKHRNLKGLL